jgi:hypothetical protein
MPAFRSVVSVLVSFVWEDFLYELKAGPAGGLRPPSGPAATRRSPGNRPHPSSPESKDSGRPSGGSWRGLPQPTR